MAQYTVLGLHRVAYRGKEYTAKSGPFEMDPAHAAQLHEGTVAEVVEILPVDAPLVPLIPSPARPPERDGQADSLAGLVADTEAAAEPAFMPAPEPEVDAEPVTMPKIQDAITTRKLRR